MDNSEIYQSIWGYCPYCEEYIYECDCIDHDNDIFECDYCQERLHCSEIISLEQYGQTRAVGTKIKLIPAPGG